MKNEINTNTLINEIMANNTAAIMLFAPPGAGKTDLLTELASRYRTVFWFSADNLKMNILSNYLIDKIVKDEDAELKKKLNQFVYCKSEFNGDSVVITAILEYISNIKGNCLMVFERMESLPEKFDLSLIERLIKHCPSNLKIVISSSDYINFDYTKFEPQYPKLIDETILVPKNPIPDFEEYIKDISAKDTAFLIYLSGIVYFNTDFINTFYQEGADMVRYLSRKTCYIAPREDNHYRFDTLFANYLKTLTADYGEFIGEWGGVNIKKRYADYLLSKGLYFDAVEFYLEVEDYDMIDACIYQVIRSSFYLLRGADIAYSSKRNLVYREDKLYYSVFYAIVCESEGKYGEAMSIFDRLSKKFRELSDKWPELMCLKRYRSICRKLEIENDELKAAIIRSVNEYRRDYPDFITLLYRAVIEFRKDLDLTLADLEGELSSNNILYVKNMEHLANTYYDLGNYKRALEITKWIKEYIPWYVIPHHLIAFRYYEGEIDVAERLANEALKFALENDITKDISFLYNTLGMIDLYYGRTDEAFVKYDTAVSLNKDDDYVKFYIIGQRCIVYAKYKDAAYAKEVAHIYLKYCERFKPKYTNIMQLALSFAYLKLGDNEKAYYYATKCVQSSQSRTTNWLLGMTIATNYMMAKADLKNAVTLLKNIFRSSYNYGMEMLVVDFYYDIFKNLIIYAREHEIETEYIEKIETRLAEKNKVKKHYSDMKINMFGDVMIMIGGKEVKWKTRKSKDLFMHYVLANEKGVDRNVIINYFWKDYLYESAINNLKTTNNIIRKTLDAGNIDYALNYINSKYSVTVKNLECDYYEYTAVKNKYNDDAPLTAKVKMMNQMLKIYKSDFATDINHKDFADERRNLKQEMIINLLKLIRQLAKQGEYIEAKRFLSSLISLDKQNDYSHMETELDTHIIITS